jgi:hypothetical protein
MRCREENRGVRDDRGVLDICTLQDTPRSSHWRHDTASSVRRTQRTFRRLPIYGIKMEPFRVVSALLTFRAAFRSLSQTGVQHCGRFKFKTDDRDYTPSWVKIDHQSRVEYGVKRGKNDAGIVGTDEKSSSAEP